MVVMVMVAGGDVRSRVMMSENIIQKNKTE